MKKMAWVLAIGIIWSSLILGVGCTQSPFEGVTESKTSSAGETIAPTEDKDDAATGGDEDMPLTEEEQRAALRLEIDSRLRNRTDSSTWEPLLSETPDQVDVYRYEKQQGVSAEKAGLTVSTNGALGMEFSLSVLSATDGELQFQLKGGADFALVTDSRENVVEVQGDPTMPYVLLKQGERYTIQLDFSGSSGYVSFLVWYAKAAKLEYSNLSFFHASGAANTFFRQVIIKSQEARGYFAWPSVERLDGNRLIAVCSGYRQKHVDPYGKIVGWISEDNGQTWGEPFVIADTVLDDRDPGVIYWKGRILVTWFTAPNANYSSTAEWAEWCSQITPEMERRSLGPNVSVSEDGGRTWSEPVLIPMFSPHGMIQSPQGELVYVGYNQTFSEICMMTSTNGVNWSSFKMIASATQKESYGFEEPHAVYAEDGTLIVQLRTKTGIYQCELAPKSDTFTAFRLICNAGDTPPQLIRLQSGALLMTYGYRGAPYGVRARVSHDNGATWGKEIIVTADGFDHDMGYPDTVELADGRLLTVYYQKDTIEDRSTGILQVIWEIPKALRR